MFDSLQQYVAAITLGFVVIGCLGNLLSLMAFLNHMTSVNTLLAALSFVDLCLLLFSVPVFVLPHLGLWVDTNFQTEYYTYMLNYVYPVNLIMQTCSIYIMVLITMERWTAVCRPLQVRIWCTPRTSRYALGVIVLFAVSYNLVRFWEYSMHYTPAGYIYDRHLRDFETHPYYMVGYYTGLYLLTHFLIPFGVIIVMNGHVCKSIIKLRRAREMLTRQQQREQSTTMMLLIVTLIFAISNTLPFLLNLAECFKPDLFTDDATQWYAYQLNDLSNLLVVFNSSTTFIIYLGFSEKYRQTTVRVLFGCCVTFPKDVKYNSLASRTHSIRVNSSLYRHSLRDSTCQMKNSSSQELFLRPLCRTERAASEYNERIKRSPTNGPTSSNKLSPMSLTPASLPQSSVPHRRDLASNSSTRSFSPSLLEKRTGGLGKQATKPCQKQQVKSYRQQSQPIRDSPPKSLKIVEQRRMSDNPQSLSRSATPVSILTLKNSSIERKSTLDSNASNGAWSDTDSSVPSVIVTLLKDEIEVVEEDSN